MPWGAPYLGSKNAQLALFDNLVATYPSLIKKETIGYTFLGKPLPMYRVGNPYGGKFLFDGEIHGCSDLSAIVHYLFLKWLLESHQRVIEGSTDIWDVRAYNIIEKKCLLCVPIVNIDRSERKNANGGAYPNGVDLNRNFTYNWINAGSTTPTSDYYRGTSAASEPETQAMEAVFVNEKPEIYVNFHNWGGAYIDHHYASSAQQTFGNQVMTSYNTIRQQLGVSFVYPVNQVGRQAGLAASQAVSTSGVKASFLCEICIYQVETAPPPTYDQIEPIYYARVKPILIALAEAVSDAPHPAQKYLFSQWQDGDLRNPKSITIP